MTLEKEEEMTEDPQQRPTDHDPLFDGVETVDHRWRMEEEANPVDEAYLSPEVLREGELQRIDWECKRQTTSIYHQAGIIKDREVRWAISGNSLIVIARIGKLLASLSPPLPPQRQAITNREWQKPSPIRPSFQSPNSPIR